MVYASSTDMSRLMPTRALGLLLVIGFIDLVATATLHAGGYIVELNPLMRPLLLQGEWLFALVKGTTLLLAWVAMAWYARQNRDFVRKACLLGSGAYLVIWAGWFVAAL